MCGITGFFTNSFPERIKAESNLRCMMDALSHRGPDDHGMWMDPHRRIALGHRRLAIVDLSVEGHQPMASARGRYVIVFNGEIYNFREVRKEIEATIGEMHWRGHSDTEVVLASFETWGIEASLPRFVGMFALAVWDREMGRLSLSRDRLGEKPLYFGYSGQSLLFASELKSFERHPDFAPRVDPEALPLYLRFGYIPAPHTIYSGVHKLYPGTLAHFRIEDIASLSIPDPIRYWSLSDALQTGLENPSDPNDPDIVDRFESILTKSVVGQMVSDVPLGAFLSGGVDSSTIVALMQANSDKPVRTFSIGFTDSTYNEANYAKSVAKHLGTDHTELYVSPKETVEAIPSVVGIYDEPFADSSQIPTYLVSKLARTQVTVSLSGDGGDEMFGGYNRYLYAPKIWNSIRRVCLPVRRGLGGVLGAIRPRTWDSLSPLISLFSPSLGNHGQIADKAQKVANILKSSDQDDLYRRTVSQWQDPLQLLENVVELDPLRAATATMPITDSFIQRMMYVDALTYLPDDILVKVDRAAMAVSLETRVPLLDHRVVEFACTVPTTGENHGASKWLLRSVLYKYVPPQLIERPKQGFAIPIGDWLRSDLTEWANDLLHSKRLAEHLRLAPVMKLWEEHLHGVANRQGPLWAVLMLSAWLNNR